VIKAAVRSVTVSRPARQSIRILLVFANPHQAYPVAPYGLEILRSRLLANQVPAEIEVVNPFLEDLDPDRRMAQVLADFEPELIGLSLRNLDNAVPTLEPDVPPDGAECDIVGYMPAVRRLVDVIRERAPEAACVLGGSAFTPCPAQCMDYLRLDYGIIGAGEASFEALATGLLAAGGPYRERAGDIVSRLPGGCYRVGGRVEVNPTAPVLSAEPAIVPAIAPAYRLLSRLLGLPVAVRTKTGCPLRCSYCVDPVNMRRTDTRPIEHVLDDLEFYRDEYGLTQVHIADAELNLPYEDHLLELCAGLRRRGLHEQIRWHGYFNAVPCSDALLDALAAAGCVLPSFSIDGFDDATLLGNGKNYRTRHVLDLLGRLEGRIGHRFRVQLGVLLGGPGQTLSSIDTAVDMMLRYADLGAWVGYSVGVRVYPGTPLGRKPLLLRHLYGVGGWRERPADQSGLTRLDQRDLIEPVVYCGPLPPRELAGHIAQRVAGHPGIVVIREGPWAEARLPQAVRLFNVGVHHLASGNRETAAAMLATAQRELPGFRAAAAALELAGGAPDARVSPGGDPVGAVRR
jgi:radical SAM superfamily enzyme YgiQ (UPF0313 family)